MRVSDSMLRDFLLSSQVSARAAYLEAAQQASSGKRFNRPSDAPRFAARTVDIDRLNTEIDAMDASRFNVQSNLEFADNILGHATDQISNVKALVIQTLNGDTSDDEYSANVEAVKSALVALVANGNAQGSNGQYLFGGTATDRAPFDAEGNYSGSTGQRRVDVAPSLSVESSLIGSRIFGNVNTSTFGANSAQSSPNQGANALQVVRNVISALEARDNDALDIAQGDLDDVYADVVAARTAIGSRLRIIDDAEFLVDDLRVALQTERGTTAGIELSESATKVTAAQLTLQILDQLGNSLTQSNLLTFIG